MATITKNFKIKQGLIVEGAEATVAGNDILTKKQADQDYIVSLIGGTATDQNTPSTIVKRNADGNFSAGTITANLSGNVTGDVTGDLTGNADTATALQTARTIELTGDITGSVSFDGTQNVQISTSLDADFATDAEVATAKAEAISDAATDATTKANAAQAAAEATASADATTKANAAQAAAIASSNTYTDGAVAGLVDSAPDLLNTLNELAAAIADNPNYATDVANLVATKADTSYVDSEISDLDTAAQGYANTAQSNAESFATTAANNAQTAAEDYADGLAVNYDAAGSASAAQAAAQSYADGLDSATNTRIDDLDTDDVAEGLNKYFTDQRAQDAVATDIANAISGVNSTIEALDTDDISEGSNLYFTNQRAIDAVGGNINDAIAAGNANASPTYQEINFTWATKQVGTYTFIANSGVSTVYTWNGNSFPAAKFLVRVREGQHSQVSEVLVTKDDAGNVAITEYAIVHTNGILGDVTAEFSNGSYSLKVNAQNNSTEVIVSGMLLAYGD